jgi:hypothetical protein
MNFEDYIQNISFKFMGPQTYFKGFGKISRGLNLVGISLEVMNTNLPENRKAMVANLIALLKIPRMSTFAIGAIINKGISDMSREQCFLNVGVWHGFSYLSGMINNQMKTCIGVDNFSEFGGPRDQFYERYLASRSPAHQFFEMDYKHYLKEKHTGKIGFYIYDGEHDYANHLLGLRLAEPYFSDDCIILVDDTNVDEPRCATLDFMRKSKNRYKILLDIQTLFNRHPTFWNGIMVLKKEGSAG